MKKQIIVLIGVTLFSLPVYSKERGDPGSWGAKEVNEFYAGMEDGCKKASVDRLMTAEEKNAVATFCRCMIDNLKTTLTATEIKKLAQSADKKDTSVIEKFMEEKTTAILPMCVPEEKNPFF